MKPSNYAEPIRPRNDVVTEEITCPACFGTGEDRKIDDADCLECWGDGTIVVEIKDPRKA